MLAATIELAAILRDAAKTPLLRGCDFFGGSASSIAERLRGVIL
jgi:hypothetical protein